MSDKKRLPLVYSCSGCSSAAQAANYIALKLAKEGHAEMSCVAGVGGRIPHLVKIAQSGRKVISIDGCSLLCSQHCLKNVEVTPEIEIDLRHFGVAKNEGGEFDRAEADEVYFQIVKKLSGL